MSELPPAQFRKTKSGTWAVMGPLPTLEAALAGDGRVDVQKKSGDWSKFTVVSLGKPFDVDGVQMCYGYSTADEGPPQGKSGTDENSSGGSRGPFQNQPPPPQDSWDPGANMPDAPPRDDSEPLPEYQGGADDEWLEF